MEKLKNQPKQPNTETPEAKNEKPYYTPVYINGARKKAASSYVFAAQLAVRIVLICMCTTGLSMSLAGIYRVPVSAGAVLFTALTATLLFSLLFLFVKKRVIAALIVFAFLLIDYPEMLRKCSVFADFILNRLDSRLLDTARYAARDMNTLLESGVYKQNIAWVFLFICVVISFIITAGSRGKYIGVILVTTIISLIPAFSAEIVSYNPAIDLLAAGMAGVYTTWVSHISDDSVPNKEKRKKENQEKKTKKSFTRKLFPGTLPYYYKHSRNAAAVVTITLIASAIAKVIFPTAIVIDWEKIYNDAVKAVSEISYDFSKFFKYNFGTIESNGYFNLDINPDMSSGLSIDRPTSGDIPILTVTLENNDEKVYLKGDIGVDFTGQGWTSDKKSDEYGELSGLLEDFYPETQARVYQLKVRDTGFSPTDEYFGLQEISIEYLVSSKLVFIPTEPYDFDYKNNSRYNWSKDGVVRAKSKLKNFNCLSVYPKMSNEDFAHLYGTVRYWDANGFFDGIEWNLPDGMTTREYNEKIGEYNRLVGAVYRDIPVSEKDNIEKLLAEMGFSPNGKGGYTILDVLMASYMGYDSKIITGESFLDEFYTTNNGESVKISFAQYVCDYLKNAYSYSLSTDNTAGGNTPLGNFLFETGAGHCAMYASAMTLAMRELGFPARYVTGYTVSGDGKKIVGGYEYQIRQRDLHAWTEVYFEGIGWLPFDPTSGNRGGGIGDSTSPATPPRTTPPVTPTTPPATTFPPLPEATTPPATPPVSPENGGGFPWDLILIIIIGSLIPIILISAAVLEVKAVDKKEKSRLARFKTGKDNKTAEEMYRFMFGVLRLCGIDRQSGETPIEFAERVDGELTEAGLSLENAMPIFEKLEFSNFDLTEAEYNALYAYVAELYRIVVTEQKRLKRFVRREKLSRNY